MKLNIPNIPAKGVCVALGTFDGVHLGHAAVFKEAVKLARRLGCESAALLFAEHPLKSLGGNPPPLLTTREAQINEIKKLGIEHIFTIDFSQICALSPEAFVDEILFKTLHAKGAVCGYNYRFGKNAAGSAPDLLGLCLARGITVRTAHKIETDGLAVSSTAIRAAIEQGETELALKMLGRLFSYDFTVRHGQKLGRLLGAPTINQTFPENFIKPKRGVYASAVRIGDEIYPGVTNFGMHPTVGETAPQSETFIIGYSGDLYGKNVPVGLIKFMREELKFPDVESLAQQISEDAEKAKTIFEELFRDYERNNKGSFI